MMGGWFARQVKAELQVCSALHTYLERNQLLGIVLTLSIAPMVHVSCIE